MQPGFVRIIGGKWRSRRLVIPEVTGLRPTPDRVRETLFNWLSPVIAGAYCLDAFAGSGVLGLEALSRGAAHVVMTDASIAVVTALQQTVRDLGTDNADIYCARQPEQLKPVEHLFDIVFLDPPYAANILLSTCFYLEQNQFLAPSALIYLEAESKIEDNALPSNWQIVQAKRAGQVYYHLIKRMRARG